MLTDLSLLQSHLGPVDHLMDITLDPIPETPTDKLDLLKLRRKVKDSVLSCDRCALADGCKAPVPYDGPSGGLFVALGEAPGPREDRQGKPFIGKSGQMLRRHMESVGIDSDNVMYMNMVSCFPNTAGSIKTPSDREVKACRRNLSAQLKISGTKYILLVGATATRAFFPELDLSIVAGDVFFKNPYVCMPIYHPAAALRGRRDIGKKIKEDLDKWSFIVRGELPEILTLRTQCVKCRGTVSWYDPNGVPYCIQHKVKINRKKRRKR